MDSTKLPTNRILVNRTQPISQEGSLHGSTHAQKEALSVLLTEETLLLENQKNGKGTERTDHSRTGVSQAHFKQIWDWRGRYKTLYGSARRCNRCGPTAGTHSRRSSDHLHINFQV